MRTGFLTVSLAFLMSLFVDAASSVPAPAVAAQATSVDTYPQIHVPFAGGVTGLPDLVYAAPLGYRPLALDIYLPPSSVSRPPQGFPLVIFVHGGGWLAGDSHQCGAFVDFPGVLASLAQRGYVVASVNYRFSGEAIFPAQILDIKASILWLKGHAAAYGLNPEEVILWGASAGGHLAALAAVTGGVKSFTASTPTAGEGIAPPFNDRVLGAAIWYGVYDFSTLVAQARADHAMSRDSPKAPEWRLLGCYQDQCKNGQIAAASPVTYVSAQSPPMLLIAGDHDTTVPCEQTREMAAKLKAAGVATDVLILPGANHAFIAQSPEATRAVNLQALEVTFAYFDKLTGRSR